MSEVNIVFLCILAVGAIGGLIELVYALNEKAEADRNGRGGPQ